MGIYIAGPECFLPNGYSLWWSHRKRAEYKGFEVTMPTATELKLDAEDKRLNAEEIFADLLMRAEASDAIIADLRSFRGTEPDGGTVFEMGMMKGKGARLYGYDASLLSVVQRNPHACIENGVLVDEKGFPYPYSSLPFPPSVWAESVLVEGGFDAALAVYAEDIRRERIGLSSHAPAHIASEPEDRTLFLSTWKRYSPDWPAFQEKAGSLASDAGWKILFPTVADDYAVPEKVKAAVDKSLADIERAQVFIADLNDFRGYEPSADTAFESGYAFALGKRCIGFMEDTRIMRERIPNKDGLDSHGYVVENFDYPINLMFSCSMEIGKAASDDLESILSLIIQAD